VLLVKILRLYLFLTAALFVTGCTTQINDSGAGKTSTAPIVVYGDTRTDNDTHTRIVADIVSTNPVAVFHTGDLVENGADPAEWVTFNQITAEMRTNAEFYPCLGNHEVESPLYFQNFTLPGNERWYAVVRQGIHFIILDTNSDFSTGSEQNNWLRQELAKPGGKFTAVVFHHPPFSMGRFESINQQVQEVLVPLFEVNGVDVVFNGHEHNYQHFLHNGIHYLIIGGGGAPLYDRTNVSTECKAFSMVYNYSVVSIEGDKLIVNVFDIDKQHLDSVVIASR
jgi:acid phosphatase type 7